MIRATLAFTYFSYLILSGGTMVQGLKQAQHSSAKPFQANVCRLAPEGCPSSL